MRNCYAGPWEASADSELPLGVPSIWAQRLQEAVAPLASVAARQAVCSYVLYGEPTAVLTGARLATGPAAAALYEHFNELPAAVALRWGKVLEGWPLPVSTYIRLPRGLHWPELLLVNASTEDVTDVAAPPRRVCPLSIERLESMLVEDGLPASALLTAAFATPVNAGYGVGRRLTMVCTLRGYSKAVSRHLDAIRPLLLPPAVPQRLHVLDMLRVVEPLVLDQVAAEVCELAVSRSKQVRVVAGALLDRFSQASVAALALERLALQGKPEQRIHALRLMAGLGKRLGLLELVRFALDTAAVDNAASVRALVKEWETADSVDTQVNSLFSVALGSGKSGRRSAQDALQHYQGKVPRIAASLSDPKSEIRLVAVEWLTRLRDPSSLSALQAALTREKNEVVACALVDALTALGQRVEPLCNREILQKQARQWVEKNQLRDIEWVSWDLAPGVRWSESRQWVGLEVLQWLVCQAIKQQSVQPSGLLRQYCAVLHLADLAAFVRWLLEQWLTRDVIPNLHVTVGSKGVLAIVACCGDAGTVSTVESYLYKYFGARASQGKALLAMLAQMEHPAATQLLLAVSQHFRTRSFQRLAHSLAAGLAERQGVTLDELADRAIATAGFDAEGELKLQHGSRCFTARLLPNFKIQLFAADGKRVNGAISHGADARVIGAVRERLTAVKKELKAVVEQQTLRLQQAFATARVWTYVNWAACVQRHPIMRLLAQRLIWVAVDAEGRRQSVRVRDDGSLADLRGDTVVPPGDASLCVARDALLGGADVTSWLAYLQDHEISPLFPQLGLLYPTAPVAVRGPTEMDPQR